MSDRDMVAHVADLIRATRDKEFYFWKALNEMIDNSIDSGSTIISVEHNGYDLEFIDNGAGFEDFEALRKSLDFGGSAKQGNNIGRYGVGLKDASIKYSTKTIIESNGMKCVADWDRIMREAADPRVITQSCDFSKGCRIVFENFETKGHFKNEIQSRYYGKLIQKGRIRLIIKGEEVEPAPFPFLRNEIHHCFEFEGKTGTISGGVLTYSDHPDNHYSGYNIFYNDRLINTNNTDGKGDVHSGSFCFSIEVNDNGENKWTLGTNKTKLEGDKRLINFLYESFTKPLLEEELERQKKVNTEKLAKQIKRIFNGEDIENDEDSEIEIETRVDHTKPNKPGKSGPVEPKGTGGKHTTTTSTSGNDGDRDGSLRKQKQKIKAKKLSDCIHISWARLPDKKLCAVDYHLKRSEVMKIVFNLMHPEIEKRKEAIDSYFFAHIAQIIYSSQKYIQSNKSDLTFAQEVLTQTIDENKLIVRYNEGLEIDE
jgi:hypothetical protein